MVAATALNIVLNGYLIFEFQRRSQDGAVGSAIALVVTEVAMTVAALLLLPGLLNRRSWGRLLRSAFATAVMSGAVWASSRYELAVETIVGAAMFAAAALAMRVVQVSEVRALLGLIMRSRQARIPE